MIQNNLDVSRLSLDLSTFMSPPTDADEQQIHTFELLLSDSHLFVTDEELSIAMQLVEEPSEESVETLVDGEQVSYIRSWAIEVGELAKMVARWNNEDCLYPEVNHWNQAIAAHPRENVIYLRYVGTATSPKTPQEPFEEDIKTGKSGFLDEFLSMRQEVVPLSYQTARVFKVKQATLPAFAAAPHRDDRERVLIHLFGFETLLNQAGGGFYASYLPKAHDHALFKQINTDVFAWIKGESKSPTLAVRQKITTWANSVAKFADEHPTTTGTVAHPFADSNIETIKSQRVGRTFKGFTIIALLGKDVTREEYLAAQPFLAAHRPMSRAGHLVRDVLSRLQAWEASQTSLVAPADSAQLDLSFLPFADLFPYLRHTEKDACRAFAHEWVQIVQPMILMTLGRAPSSITTANFAHDYGIPNIKYLTHVGIPKRQTFAPLDWIFDETNGDTPPKGQSMIVIPHLDPGYEKYHPAESATMVRRVILLTWIVSLVAGMKAMECLKRGVADRDSIVDEVMSLCSRESPLKAVRTLHAELQKAKDELLAKFEKQRKQRGGAEPIVRSDSYKGERGKIATARVERAGFAVEAPQSGERKQQVQTLWRLQPWDTMLHLREAQNREELAAEWKEWAMGRAEGTSYFMASMQASLASKHDVHPLAHVVGTEWMKDSNLVDKALQTKAQQLKRGLPGDFYSQEKQKRRILQRYGKEEDDPVYQFTPVLEGRKVVIHASKQKLILRWKDTVKNVDVLIRIPVAKEVIGVEDEDADRFSRSWRMGLV
ncbi:hypothetical protein HDV00_001350 [Rhizophlyctis rosea]|nr:hypothetical protein HDV00_001350 [Rhizophlyctis rosea]